MPTTEKVVMNIKVDLVVNTSNELKRIVFGLEKETDDDGLPTWTIHFKLFQRTDKATPYGDPRVSLDIVVDKDLNGKAAATADKGLNAKQVAYLAGPGAAAAVNPGANGEPAGKAIQRTLIK